MLYTLGAPVPTYRLRASTYRLFVPTCRPRAFLFSFRAQHRDLKMENSLFEDSSLVPIVKVIDFGLSTELKLSLIHI